MHLKLLLLFLVSLQILTAQKISYTLSFPNIAHHEACIQMEVSGATAQPLIFRMSRSSPGRYATHEFGKNVYDIEATDAEGKTIPVKRLDADVWQVSGFKSPVTISYTLYGNHSDGTYAGIDPNSIHLNMPATLLWVKGLETAPVQVTFAMPDTSFTIATQLKPTNSKTTFTAPNLQYLMDSPVKIGKLQWREWPVSNGATTMKIRLAVEANATGAQIESLTDNVKRITEQAKAVFGEYPAYDYGTYTFLASLNPYVQGDGMEHRNSTMISTGQAFNYDYDNVEVFAHEFFHCWNVERIRPKTLEPFNFEKSNMSNELWCAEGFTQYYGGLLLIRAGLEQDTAYRSVLAGLINAKLNSAGANKYTPIEASNTAVFSDAGVSIDKNNFSNTFTSYYTYGGALALALDLMLRNQGKSLDDFMRQMWRVHGKPEVPYTVADMQQALAAITTTTFAKSFFDNYVYKPGKPDYETLLANAGFVLQKVTPGKAWIGRTRFTEKGGLTIANNTIRNTPLYNAGLDVNDVIVSVNGEAVKAEADLIKILNAHKAGDALNVVYKHHGEDKRTTVTAIENPWYSVVTFEQAGKPVTDAIRAFRKSWLGAK
jgi:predicted metalloprotease with PDZ domain